MDSFIPFFNRVRDELISIEDKIPDNDIKNESEKAAQINDLTRIFPIFQSLKKWQMHIFNSKRTASAFLRVF